MALLNAQKTKLLTKIIVFELKTKYQYSVQDLILKLVGKF